ncbi:MAG: carbon-nitrogen hydrolase family protein [Bacteroidota bacterium]
MPEKLTVAIVQASPAFLDLKKSLEKMHAYLQEAVAQGAKLVVFGETWLCGYPSWLDHCPNIALWDHEPTKEIFLQMLQSGVAVPSDTTEKMGKWAKQFDVTIMIGVNEVVPKGKGNGTIYNTLLLFSPEGQLVNHHRKLMPTYTEKLLYGHGDGRGLRTVDTGFGEIGGLICWEHWMPLSRQALHDEKEIIHVAVWPCVFERHQIASRHYAFEGRCFVVAAGQILRVRDMPKELTLPPHLADNPDHFLLNGGSCVIGPDGNYLMEPQFDVEGVLICEIPDLNRAYKERMTLDVTGHYQRMDVFDFSVKR